MEFSKCRDVPWKGPKKRNKPDVLATTAKHPDERSQISRYGWMQPTYMRSVSFWGKFTSGSRISASRSDLLKVPNGGLSQCHPPYVCLPLGNAATGDWQEKLFHFVWTSRKTTTVCMARTHSNTMHMILLPSHAIRCACFWIDGSAL